MNTLHGVNIDNQNTFNNKDERDIQKRLQSILDDLDSNAAFPFTTVTKKWMKILKIYYVSL